MPRRPDLIRASLYAGLICLMVCLPPGGGLGGGETLARSGSQGQGAAALTSQSSEAGAPLLLAQRPTAPPAPAPKPGGSSGKSPLLEYLVRFFTGGVLGPLLWHYVFNYPLALFWQQGLWPPGFLDLAVAVALGHVGYRGYARWRRDPAPPEAPVARSFLRPDSRHTCQLEVTEEAKAGLAAISAQDQQFNLADFKEEMQDLLQQVYTAWNQQQVESLNGRIKDSLLDYLRMGLKIMSLREEVSRLEDLALEDMTIINAGSHDGQDFITLRFRGSIMDYVLDRVSGKLLAGSMAYPNVFSEIWELGRSRGQPWVLLDIREH